ncbi:OmpA family protein [Rhodoferax ferrireducens]|uniref:OmpA family protein n=1 Tax=Rhodoferax ferrireducens TaxID=192843 RepID=UPI000E0D4091|nr:OmpA family protein [Rhodoferax ferrireducens]
MKNVYLTPVLLAIAVLVGACSSGPKTTGLLDLTRSEYRMAQSNPKVAAYAPVEMRLASVAMAQAEAAAIDKDSDTKIDKLAYLARQKIALTQEVAKQKSAELEVAASGKERDQLLIDQRTNEANIAKMNAEKARLATQQAQGQTADAQRQAQEAQARAAQLEAQLADLAAKKTERGMVITLGDVLFGTDLARLNADGMRTAQKLADVLQQNPQRTVLVEGFTDSTGAADHNQALSERRATAVQSALQDLGVARTRVAIRGYGESHPVASNDSAQSRQLNRRVEIVLSDDSGKVMAR